MRQSMTLPDWIDHQGVPTVARLLGVNPNTVRYWKWGVNLPRPEQMRAIKKLTKGVVGYEEIIDGVVKRGK